MASAGLGHLRGEAGRPCRWCGARVNDQLAAHSPRESVTAAAEYGVSRIGPREHQDHGCAAIENLLDACCRFCAGFDRSEEHTSELQSLMRISYAVFCLKKKKNKRK